MIHVHSYVLCNLQRIDKINQHLLTIYSVMLPMSEGTGAEITLLRALAPALVLADICKSYLDLSLEWWFD